MCTLCPFQNKNIAFPFFFIVDLIVTVDASQPIEWGLSDPGNRENNVIFISGDISSPPHYHSTVMNGSFCPHNHERACHLSVSPNWLFTTFQHRQTHFWSVCHSVWHCSAVHRMNVPRNFSYFQPEKSHWMFTAALTVTLTKQPGTEVIWSLGYKVCGQNSCTLYQRWCCKDRLESFINWKE